MSNHYIAINRGVSGMTQTDFTVGTSSTAGTDIELRIADGANLTIEDVRLAMTAFDRWLHTYGLSTLPARI